MTICEECREPLGNKHTCRHSDIEGDRVVRQWVVNGEHRFVIDKKNLAVEWQNETEEGVVLVVKPMTIAQLVEQGEVRCYKCGTLRKIGVENVPMGETQVRPCGTCREPDFWNLCVQLL
jgi:hypothetical protein